MSKSKKPKKVKIKSVKYGGYESDDDGLLDPKDVPLMKGLEERAKMWDLPKNKKTPALGKWIESTSKSELPYERLENDLAYLQVCVQAMGERLDMLEAENVRIRSLWGGTTHTGVPFWVGSVTTGKNTITA